jgi:hypothetical protein
MSPPKEIVYSPTGRGWRLLASILLLDALGAFFLDPILGAIGVGLAALLIYQYLNLRNRASRLGDVRLEPGSMDETLIAGEELTHPIMISSVLDGTLNIGDLEVGAFQPRKVEGGGGTLLFSFSSPLSGKYLGKEVTLKVSDGFNLFTSALTVPFTVELEVYPRVLPVALEAARFLSQAGESLFGEESTRTRGAGMDYMWSRPYMAGDSLKRIDWKASARLNQLVVKDYYAEGGRSPYIIFEASAPDPVSLDILSSEFLRCVLSFSREGFSMGLKVTRDGEIIYENSDLSPLQALVQAMRSALEAVELRVEDLNRLLDPTPPRQLGSLLRALGMPVPRMEGEEVEIRLDRETIIYTTLTRDPAPIIELARDMGDSGGRLHLIQPTTPWLYSRDLKTAYDLHQRYRRLNRVLEREGFYIHSSTEELGLKSQIR